VLRRHYKFKSSGFENWNQKDHAEQYLLYDKNIASTLSIDEVSLSKGELYTFITNKNNKGRQGTIVACVNGTKSTTIIDSLLKIPLEKRILVKEVTLDMASNMELAVKKIFPNAILTTDHFHVIKLAMEALQHLRVHYRWYELDQEHSAINTARNLGLKYSPPLHKNGDTPKQLLARSRYVLAKRADQWTKSQKERAQLIFKHYPLLATAYSIVMQLRMVYKCQQKTSATVKLNAWIDKIKTIDIKQFATVAYTIQARKETILNYFNNRNTNANAESFNAKIKLFRANLRGVIDIPFFMFRLEKLFA
jgi:transposase